MDPSESLAAVATAKKGDDGRIALLRLTVTSVSIHFAHKRGKPVARIIYTDSEQQRIQTFPKAERIEAEFAALILEASRRTVLLGEDIQEDAGLDDDTMALIDRINAGQEPPRIKEVVPSREERQMLRALGAGKSKDERKRIRLNFESETLLKRAEDLAPYIAQLKQSRRVDYPFARKRALQVMLEKFETDVQLPPDEMADLRAAVWEPTEKHAALVHREEPRETDDGHIGIEADRAPFVVDLQQARWHRFQTEDRDGELPMFTTNCGLKLVDLHGSQRGRILQVLHFATMEEDTQSMCEECWPERSDLPADVKIRPGKYGLYLTDSESNGALADA